ncbi:MAG: putative rane protein [Herbinix sp.]|jgi:membrane protease YdiL (CAAX protease family)|nr:putative rane protein [Herbinix sp.]
MGRFSRFIKIWIAAIKKLEQLHPSDVRIRQELDCCRLKRGNFMDDNGKQAKKILNRSGLALFIMGLAIIAASLVIELVLYHFVPDLLNSEWYAMGATAISVAGVGLPVFFLIIKNVPSTERRTVIKLRISEFIVYFFICVAAMYLADYLGVFINMLIEFMIGGTMYNPLEDVILGSNRILTILYGAIAGPIVEELIFRKLLLDKVRRFGDLPAILITGIAFGLFHMNLLQFFYATVLGFIFAYVTLKTNTVRYAILLHIMINSIGVILAPLALQEENMGLLMIMGLWVLASITIGCTLFAVNVKKIHLTKGVPVDKKSVYFLNTGTILFIILCVAMSIRVLLID